MIIRLEPELEAAVNEAAVRRGVAPEMLVLDALRQRFLHRALPAVTHYEWERRLVGLARECGVSLPDAALSRQALYE